MQTWEFTICNEKIDRGDVVDEMSLDRIIENLMKADYTVEKMIQYKAKKHTTDTLFLINVIVKYATPK